jgi:hypothetical protein
MNEVAYGLADVVFNEIVLDCDGGRRVGNGYLISSRRFRPTSTDGFPTRSP